MSKFISAEELNEGYFISEFYDRIEIEALAELISKAKASVVKEIHCHHITDKKTGQQGIVLIADGKEIVVLQNIARCPPIC